MDIQLTESQGIAVCQPIGELDAYTVTEFREALGAAACVGGMVIDLSEVPFMDSAGLGALIGVTPQSRGGGG